MKKVIVIVGPTAIGKTRIAIELAKRYHTEIISGDSVAVYQGLDIGSAKPSIEEMSGVIHHLIDVLEPTAQYSVATFQKEARKIIDERNLTIISGGTGLYIGSVLFDYEFAAAQRNIDFEKKYENYTNEELYEELKSLDSYFDQEKIHCHNRKRVLRALEIVLDTNKSISTFNQNKKAIYDAFIIYLNVLDRKVLYERINNRVDMMIEDGLLEEVEGLHKKNIYPSAIGYKEFIPYFKGEIPLQNVIDNIKLNSRHLAKRQITWFKNQLKTNFYEVDLDFMDKTINEIDVDIKRFLSEVK